MPLKLNVFYSSITKSGTIAIKLHACYKEIIPRIMLLIRRQGTTNPQICFLLSRGCLSRVYDVHRIWASGIRRDIHSLQTNAT